MRYAIFIPFDLKVSGKPVTFSNAIKMKNPNPQTTKFHAAYNGIVI